MIYWPEKTLGKICLKITDGAHNSPKSVKNGKPMASVKDLNTYGLNLNSARHISEDDFQKLVKQGCKPLVGDVLIAKDGNSALDTVCVQNENEDVVLLSSVAILRPNTNEVISEFLKFYFSNKRTINYLKNNFISGAAIPRVVLKDFKKAIIKLPPLTEQKAIASVLGALDDKIENNRRMNETLEEMARAIFKSWFVDFDPVHAKAAGNTPVHMDADTAALFPSSFGDDGLPVGWKNSIIGDEVQIFGGGTPSTKEPTYWDGGEFNWCTPKDLSPLVSPVLLNTSRKITESGLKKISSGLLPAGTLLMSSRAPVGYLAISQIPVAVNQGFIAMKCTKRLSNLYALFWCEQNMNTIKNNAGGSTFAEISKTNFKPIPIICPSEEVITAFDLYIGPVFSKVVSNLKENQTIAELRDTLLPKLMSGEIRVADAKREVEAAL